MEGERIMKVPEVPELGHVGYMVDNVDDCAKMFGTLWGIDDFVVYDFVPQRVWAYGEEIFDCKLRIAMGTPKVGPKIELIQYISGTNLVMNNFVKEKGQNIHHVAYYLDTYEEYNAWKDYALELGGSIIFEAEVEDEVMGKRSSFYCEYPGIPGVFEFSKRPTKLK